MTEKQERQCPLELLASHRAQEAWVGDNDGWEESNTLYPEIPRPGLPCFPHTKYCGLRVECWAVWRFLWALQEKEMATHSSILSWRILWTEEPGGLPSMGSPGVGHDWSDLAAAAAWALCFSQTSISYICAFAYVISSTWNGLLSHSHHLECCRPIWKIQILVTLVNGELISSLDFFSLAA